MTADLDELLTAADGTLLARFVAGLRRDYAAISAALELPWTTSPVEGQISRLVLAQVSSTKIR
jgi:transposase